MNNEQSDNLNNQLAILVSRREDFSANSWIFFFVFLLVFIGGGFFYIRHQIYVPLSAKAEERTFIVRIGESLDDIAKNLKEEGLIRNKPCFIFYVWKDGFAHKLQAGDYLLSPAMSIFQIAVKLKNGEVIPREITVTIPEGFKISQIEERLKSKDFRFDGILPDSPIFNFQIGDFKKKYDFLRDAPDSANLEGFLFPDTYKFYPEATVRDLAEKMLDNFDRKMTSEMRNEISKQGKRIYDIVIMASLIEKEVKVFEDRRIVSGIFWRRLSQGRALESCATIAYVLNVDKWRYSVDDTRKSSPYNTYLNPGLPPGPICNSGIDSIRAAIYPKETPYDFFLTDPKTGNTIFSKTLQEHNINKAKYFNTN